MRYFVASYLNQIFLHLEAHLFVIYSYLEWLFLNEPRGNQRVSARPLHSGLKRNEFAQGTFVWLRLQFVVYLSGS